jgi:hypothetical protein
MRPTTRRALAVAGASSLSLLLAGPASAQEGFGGQGSGSATLTFQEDGDQAEINLDWEGLAAEIPDLSGTPYEALSNMPFPHAQHIHAGAEGQCPTPERDTDGNGVIDTPEGLPDYGPVVVSLTEEPGETTPGQTLDLENFPAGGSATYSRTVDLGEDAETDAGTFNPAEQVREGNAVIVIHGLDPAIMPGESALEESPLNDALPELELPLAATAPALCGVLTETGEGTFTAELRPTNPVAAETEPAEPAEPTEPAEPVAPAPEAEERDQVDPMPAPGVAAGGGSTAVQGESTWPFVLGGIGLAGAAALVLAGVSSRFARRS